MRFISIALLAVLAFCLPASAQNLGGFGDFAEEPINAPGSYQLIDDPTGSAPLPKIYGFTVTPGACSDKRYANGNSDCTFQSVRSQLYEPPTRQPEEAWYQWSMYLPTDFPLGNEQGGKGLYNFAYWHNGECPNLALVSETATGTALSLQVNRIGKEGKFTCLSDQRIDIADLKDLRGGWHRFEVFVRWSGKDDGLAKVYIDGKKTTEYRGATINAGGPPSKNYFKFGIYLCCTEGVETIAPATAYFTGLQRAKSGSELFTQAEVKSAEALQRALNSLGCDVGEPDGIVGKRTREMAVSCRKPAQGQLPSDLVAGSVDTFLKFYTSAGVAELPRGVLPVPADYLIQVAETRSDRPNDSREAITNFDGRIQGAPKGKGELSFILIGNFSSLTENPYQLAMLLQADLGKSASDVAACPGQRIEKWGDGTQHLVVLFRATGKDFTVPAADCIVAALPPDLSFEADFLFNHFTELAASMQASGSLDRVSHNGIRMLLSKVAAGEVLVGRAP